jgi:hypothetical protein
MQPIAERLWNATPKGIQDAVAMTVDRLQGQGTPAAPVADMSKATRVFIAPANYAGQAYAWARAVRENATTDAQNMIYAEINPFGYSTDYSVRWRTVTHSRAWQKAQFEALVSDFTHVIVEAQFPPLGGFLGGDLTRQVRALQAKGVHVAMVCHGSDIRLPSRHRALEAWSPFANDDWVPVEKLEKVIQANQDVLQALEIPVFLSTPGLMLDVPGAHLLPVVVDATLWVGDSPVLHRDRPRVLHAPSNPLIKGTAEIRPALAKLHDEGLVEYVEITGRTQAEMPGLLHSGDIILDQFRLGDYGVASCEAMAAGRLVISHVSEQSRHQVVASSGYELPIVEANTDNLEDVLRDVLSRRGHFREIASRGPEFVREVHDGRLSRAVLEANFLMGSASKQSHKES